MDNNKVHIEHILPQNPENKDDWNISQEDFNHCL